MSGALDKFNTEHSKEEQVAKPMSQLKWDGEQEPVDAVCTICDKGFQDAGVSPPIFCPSCKMKLQNILL